MTLFLASIANRSRASVTLVAAALVLVGGARVAAGQQSNLDMDVRARGGDSPALLVPVPVSRAGIELWSDPAAGSVVYPGDRANIYFRSERDAFVTVISVDTEGRVRLLFPRHFESGWVPGGCSVRVPERGAGYDLRFSGPSGIEYVYAVASQDRCDQRYPEWLVDGRIWDYDPSCDRETLYDVGWVIGDPLFRLREFSRELVPTPDCTDRYTSAWLSFCVGRRVDYPRTICRDCHSVGPWDPYDARCPAVRVVIDGHSCSGVIDFRLIFAPRWSYEVDRHWCDRRWRGHEPDGRWRWSSADGVKRLRTTFGREDRRDRDRDRREWDRGRGERDRSGEDRERRDRGDREPRDRFERRDRDERERGNHEASPRVKESPDERRSPKRDVEREPKRPEHRGRDHRAR